MRQHLPSAELVPVRAICLTRFGSRVTVLLPHDVTILAKTGDITIDGETVLAREN